MELNAACLNYVAADYSPISVEIFNMACVLLLSECNFYVIEGFYYYLLQVEVRHIIGIDSVSVIGIKINLVRLKVYPYSWKITLPKENLIIKQNHSATKSNQLHGHNESINFPTTKHRLFGNCAQHIYPTNKTLKLSFTTQSRRKINRIPGAASCFVL